MGEGRLLVDPYGEWVGREGIPVIKGGFGVNLLDIEVAPWPRSGANGAFVHLDGRGDFVDIQLIEIPPGGRTEPQRHLYEEVVYVLEGVGRTLIQTPSGADRSIEWRERSLLAIPLNASYRHYNTDGRSRVRLASVTNLPLMLNVFRNEDFIWNNSHSFGERFGIDEYFRGSGTFIPSRPGRHAWETIFVPDLRTFKLEEWKARGGNNIKFILADGTMHAHMSEMPVGTYKKGHRHGPDFHVFAVTGQGYSLYWYEGDEEFGRFDWTHGCVFAPSDQLFHQHFNVSEQPSRYLASAFGSLRYPTTADKLATWTGVDVSLKYGGRQIESEDEDPRVRLIYEAELAKRGLASRMSEALRV